MKTQYGSDFNLFDLTKILYREINTPIIDGSTYNTITSKYLNFYFTIANVFIHNRNKSVYKKFLRDNNISIWQEMSLDDLQQFCCDCGSQLLDDLEKYNNKTFLFHINDITFPIFNNLITILWLGEYLGTNMVNITVCDSDIFRYINSYKIDILKFLKEYESFTKNKTLKYEEGELKYFLYGFMNFISRTLLVDSTKEELEKMFNIFTYWESDTA